MMAQDVEVASSFQPLLGLAANFLGSHESQVADPMIEADTVITASGMPWIFLPFDRAKVPLTLLETTGLRILKTAFYSARGGACCCSRCCSRCRRLRDRSRAVSLPSLASLKGGS